MSIPLKSQTINFGFISHLRRSNIWKPFLSATSRFGFVSRYLHLDTTITTGRQNGVKAGDQIATVGRSGNVLSCSKTHLHFSTKIVGKPFDPTPVFNWPLEQ